jgi:hypothetical protein
MSLDRDLEHLLNRQAPGCEDESGNVTSEPSDHDKLVDAHNQIASMQATLGRIREWADTYGDDLKPTGADTYGEGKRDAKTQVKRMLSPSDPQRRTDNE